MPRIRTIKPEFWDDEKMAVLDDTTRLVFLALISMADDAGRLVFSQRQIDAFVWPYTEGRSSVDSTETLRRLGILLSYTCPSGRPLLQIVNWSKHQYVKNPSKHTLPGPTAEDLATLEDTRSSVDSTESLPTSSVDSTETLPPGSRKLEVGSNYSLGASTEDAPDEGGGDLMAPMKGAIPKVPPGSQLTYPAQFEESWEAYPRRLGSNPKKQAFQSWRQRVSEGWAAEDIHRGVERYAAFVRSEGKEGSRFVMQASTFFGTEDPPHWTTRWDASQNHKRSKAPTSGPRPEHRGPPA